MLGRVASSFVTDEALVVLHVLCSFSGGEIDLVNVHGIGVSRGSGILCWLGQWNVAISSASGLLPEPYHILVELSCLIKPLFPFPASFLLSSGRAAAVIMMASWLVTPH